jgi:hypothetical protein
MRKMVFLASVCLPSVLLSNTVSFVYNLRIAEATKQYITMEQAHFYAGGITAVGQYRLTHEGIHHNTEGALMTFLTEQGPWYLRVDGAFARNEEKGATVDASRTELDDIIVMGGYSWVHDDIKIALSCLVGIPTHKNWGLIEPQFGIGHASLGGQFDAAWTYYDEPQYKHALWAAARYIHFFPRTVYLPVEPPCLSPFEFHLGNTVDLFFAHNSLWGRHSFEFGYNPTFLFHSYTDPFLEIIAEEVPFIRSSFYVSYHCRFVQGRHLSKLIVGFSYGADHRPQNVGYHRIMTGWLGWSFIF